MTDDYPDLIARLSDDAGYLGHEYKATVGETLRDAADALARLSQQVQQQALEKISLAAQCDEHVARIAALENLTATLKQQAQIHAQEARTANATIAEIYQVVTGSKGEPGNWNGTEPVRQCIAALESQLAEATAAANENFRLYQDLGREHHEAMSRLESQLVAQKADWQAISRECYITGHADGEAEVAPPKSAARESAEPVAERIIHAIEGECDGLAITAEQASNILAYLQYGATMNEAQAIQRDAERYRKLRAADINAIHKGGVFVGLTPDNVVINGEDLDIAVDLLIDAALASQKEQKE